MADRAAYEFQTNTQRISGINREIVAGVTGRPFSFYCTTDVKVGGWFNCAKADMDFGTAGTGEVTGMGSAFNAELRLPNKTTAGGAYAALEVNLWFHPLSVQHNNPVMPTALASFNVGGTQARIDTWEDNASACIFWFKGLTESDGSVYSAGTAENMTGSLKIIIGSTIRYLMLCTNPATA